MANKLKTIAVIALSCVTLFASVPSGAREYYPFGVSDSKVGEKIKNQIIFRVNNPSAYVSDQKLKIDSSDRNITPVERGKKVYIPLAFTAENLGGTAERTENKVNVTIGDVSKTLDVSSNFDESASGTIEYRNTLYIESENFGKIFGLNSAVHDKIVTIDFAGTQTDLSEQDIQKLKSDMEYKWDNVYLGANGYATGLAVHPKDKSVFCRTDVGGMYKLDKKRDYWVRLTDTVVEKPYGSELKEIMGFALDPNDSNIIYAATAVNLIKTTDGGRSWTELITKGQPSNNGMRAGEPVAVDPNNSDIVYLGTLSDGLYISSDGGKTWIQSFDIPSDTDYGIRNIVFDSSTADESGKTQTVYVGVSGYGVYVSHNCGKSFAKMVGSPTHPARMQLVGKRLFVSMMRKGGTRPTSMTGCMYVYDGKTWKDISPAQAAVKDFCGFVVNEKNPDYIFASNAPYTNRDWWRTTDGGANWEYMGSFDPVPDFVFNPDNDDEILYVYGGGLKKIKNVTGAIETVRYDTGIEEFCTTQVMTLPGTHDLFTGNLDFGLYRNTDFFERAERIGSPKYADVAAMDYCGQNPSFCVAVGSSVNYTTGSELVEYSDDYGKTWTRATGWDAGNFCIDVAVGAQKQENGFPVVMVQAITGKNAGMYVSYDGLKTWTRMENAPGPKTDQSHWNRWNNYLVSDKVDGSTFYIAYQNIIYVSRDAGKTWKQASPAQTKPAGYTKLDSAPNMTGVLCYPGANGLYISENYGYTWRKCNDVSWAYMAAFGKGKTQKTDALYTYGTINGESTVYMSDDLGYTWRRINDGTDGICGVFDTTEISGDKNVYGRVFVTTHGIGTLVGQPCDIDDSLPVISADEFESDITGQKTIAVGGNVSKEAEVRVNGKTVPIDGNLHFEAAVELAEGENEIYIEAVSGGKQKATPIERKITYIPGYVGIKLENGKDAITTNDSVEFSGSVTESAAVYANGTAVQTNPENRFNVKFALSEGANEFEFYAVTADGNRSETKRVVITRDTIAPVYSAQDVPEVTDNNYSIIKLLMEEDGEFRVNGGVVSCKKDIPVEYFVALAEGDNTVRLEARDIAGNVAKPSDLHIKSGAKSVDTANITANYVSDSEIKLDGIPDENVWKIDKLLTKTVYGVANNITKFGVCWNEEYLYIAMDVADGKLVADSQNVFQDDCVEIYLDGDNCHASKYCTHCAQLQYRYDGEIIASGTKCAANVTDTGYTMEIAVPWKYINTTVKEGSKVGFDINAVDDDGTAADGGRTGLLSWNTPNGSAWTNPSQFATLTLIK